LSFSQDWPCSVCQLFLWFSSPKPFSHGNLCWPGDSG
jgi:hypothetical protein